ncbi:MAG: ribosome silencing factor [Chloroflexota bacterium]
MQSKITRGGSKLERDPEHLARAIVDLLADRKAEDILLLDMRPAAYVADYFVLCNGNSERHIRALAEEVRESLSKSTGERPMHIEGASDSGWVLLDYGDVVLHVFGEEERGYYALDRLWHEAVPLLRMQ